MIGIGARPVLFGPLVFLFKLERAKVYKLYLILMTPLAHW
jgi:hypothetical protein